jgi:thiaminase
MTQVEKVRQLARDCVKKLSNAVEAAPWDNFDFYSNYMAQTYFYSSHITRAIALAASKCSLDEEFLHVKLIKGLNEEKGHQFMALRDVEALGCDISKYSEFVETSAYYQTLNYKIATEGPFALLGYALVLEGLAADGFQKPAALICKTYKHEATHFVRAHCQLDLDHFDEGLEFLEKLTPAQLQIVEKNMPSSAQIYINMLNSVMTHVSAVRKAA